jgi:hypothetical protein
MSEAGSVPIGALISNADIVVKVVLLLLLAGSIWSWAVIVDKVLRRGGRRVMAARLPPHPGAQIRTETAPPRPTLRRNAGTGMIRALARDDRSERSAAW